MAATAPRTSAIGLPRPGAELSSGAPVAVGAEVEPVLDDVRRELVDEDEEVMVVLGKLVALDEAATEMDEASDDCIETCEEMTDEADEAAD